MPRLSESLTGFCELGQYGDTEPKYPTLREVTHGKFSKVYNFTFQIKLGFSLVPRLSELSYACFTGI